MNSAETTLREKLRAIVVRITQAAQSQEAAAQMNDTVEEYLGSEQPPSLIFSPFTFASFGATGGEEGEGEQPSPPADEPVVLKYGGDEDSLLEIDARDLDAELLAKVCRKPKGSMLLIFSVGNIFERCFRYTSKKSQIFDAQAQNQGTHLINLMALTEDEWDFFAFDFLEHSARAVHNMIGAYGRDAGLRSMVYQPGASAAVAGTLIYALEIPEGGLFHNRVLQLYENISSALYWSVLQQWAQWCGDAGEIQANGAKYQTAVEAIQAFRHTGKDVTRKARYW